MHVFLGVIPSGKGRNGGRVKGGGLADRRRGHCTPVVSTRQVPQPRSNMAGAGALFSCSLHLGYLIRGHGHTTHHLLQAHLRLLYYLG